MSTQKHKVYLLRTYVQGAEKLLSLEDYQNITKDDKLLLVRESKKDYNTLVYLNSKKIGKIPLRGNQWVAKMLDTQLIDLHAELLNVFHPKPNSGDQPKISIGLFAFCLPQKAKEIPKEYLRKQWTNKYESFHVSYDVLEKESEEFWEIYKANRKDGLENDIVEFPNE